MQTKYKFSDINTEELLLKIGLYEPIELVITDLDKLNKFIKFERISLSYYCPHCKKESVFVRDIYENNPNVPKIYVKENMTPIDAFYALAHERRNFQIKFNCALNNEHISIFLFYIDHIGKKLYKIGQYPSYADLNNYNLNKFKIVLGTNYYKELVKAIGLNSSNIGIGSFVYLRRIFEKLIEDTHIQVSEENNWKPDKELEYRQASMKDKIKMLNPHFKTFLSIPGNGSNIYDILSKGVHELSEDVCLAHFDILKSSIILILNEKLKELDDKKEINSISKKLNSIHSEI